MQLSVQSAQRIVGEIGSIVKQNINLMDAQGYIIASTNSSRIGHFHEGALRIVQECLPELYVTPAQATATVRAGLNLPIMHSGAIVGVIGITGEYDQVIGFGQIVKKMTEILMRESTEQDEKRLDLRVHSRFLEDWVLSGNLQPPQALAERGQALGIDIALPRRVMVVSIRDLDHYIDTAEGQNLIEKVETAIASMTQNDVGNIILRNTARQILLLRKRSDEEMYAFAKKLTDMAKAKFDVCLSAGIDGGTSEVHKAYAQANKAWRSAHLSPNGILSYDRVTLEIFAGDISRRAKEEYLRKVFRGCGYEELCRWIGLLEAYFAAEGSLTLAADALYIHKNTLQYKLKKLEELTGYDVRLPSNTPVFYMAMLFFKEVEGMLLLSD